MQRSLLVEEIEADTVDDDVYAVRGTVNVLQRRRSCVVEEVDTVDDDVYAVHGTVNILQ